MDDATAVLAGHTTKFNIPLSHFEHKYIQNCTNGKELEKIYKELIGGEVGSFPALEKLTLDRVREVKPNSQILRQDKAPLDKSALPDDERRQFDDFLSQMKDKDTTSSTTTKDHQNHGNTTTPIRTKSIVTKSITSMPTASVINKNGKPKRIVPRSYAEWGKLDQKISQEMNSDNEDDDDDDDDDDENDMKDKNTTSQSRPADQNHEKSQRLQMAEQHRLSGNTAFKSNNYQQSIDFYTKSIMLNNTNPAAYMNRAIAHYKLNNYDASTTDCSKVLADDPHHIKALFRRASCFIAKQQYEEAKLDLDILLSIDQANTEAKNLLKTIPSVQKTKGVRIPITEDDSDDNDDADKMITQPPPASVPVKIPILEVEEEEEESEPELQQPVTNASIPSVSIDIPQKVNNHARPGIDSQDASPAMFDHHFHHRDDIHQYQQTIHSQLSSSNIGDGGDDDDDDMQLGDEAGGDLLGNMSDDDANVSHSLNVSPTMEDDDNDEPPELVNNKPLQIPPLTSPTQQVNNSNTIDHSIRHTTNETHHQGDFSAVSNKDVYDNNHLPTISNNYSSRQQNSISTNPFETNDQSSLTIKSHSDQIANSNFGPTVQSWLRDLVKRRSSSVLEKPWSKSPRPWSLDKLQREIDRFNRLNDSRNAIEAAKKMLKNGVLDYHNHADHIVDTLILCAQCYSKFNKHVNTIQYATEALQYNKTDVNALMSRAKAFENEKFLLYSYADYARIPTSAHGDVLPQRTCERLADELNISEGENWREKLPKDINDEDYYFAYVKIKDNYSDDKQFDWYRERGNQLYLDACYVLAIRCYTYCIELKPNTATLYTNRAACYLKVFEPQKAMDDCNQALTLDPKSVRALYRKACAHKMARDDHSYELTLKDLIKLQPNNQTILAEYYASRRELIPREMRRIRINQTNSTINTNSTSIPSDVKQSKSATITEETILSYNELEQIRTQKLSPFSTNTPYQFTQQFNALKPDDIKSQCSMMLRLPAKGLFKIAGTATPKLVEFLIIACRTMVHAEKRYQQEHKASILPYSYIRFCFNILCELTTLPRIDSALAMISANCRASLDDLISYYSSIPSVFNDVNKLDRLRK